MAGSVSILEEYVIESGRRKISLQKWPQLSLPWQIHVYVSRRDRNGFTWVLLSTAEYFTEELARRDFEIRRPKMRDSAGEEVPMQRGKRLVQEMLTEKLGKAR